MRMKVKRVWNPGFGVQPFELKSHASFLLAVIQQVALTSISFGFLTYNPNLDFY